MSILARLFSFRGRLGRADWWLFAVALNILAAVLGAVLTPILAPPGTTWQGSETAPAQFVGMGVTLALLWPALALNVKRRHDRGAAGWPSALLFVVLLGFNSTPLLYFVGAIAAFEHFGFPGVGAFLLAIAAAWIWLFVSLGLLPGAPGPNRFGEPVKPIFA